jgi:hypothetical protein
MYYVEKPVSYPYVSSGLRGMGQVIPGIRTETQRLVVYGSLALVGAAILFFIVMKTSKGGSQDA